MAFEYVVCPHCGCRGEDDEYCAACGKMFHEDQVATSDVSVLRLLGGGLRSKAKKLRIVGSSTCLGGDTCLDPEYSSIPGNAAYDFYNDE